MNFGVLAGLVAAKGSKVGAIGLALGAIGQMGIAAFKIDSALFPLFTALQALGLAIAVLGLAFAHKAGTDLYVAREAEKAQAGVAPPSAIPAINREIARQTK